MLPRFLPGLTHAFPNLQFDIRQTKTGELIRLLREEALDVGIAATPLYVPGIHERVIFHEAFQVYLCPEHPYATRDALHQADPVGDFVWLLREGHCFRMQVLHLCSVDPSCRSGPRVAFDGDSFEALVQLVDAGIGVTILPELMGRALPKARRAAQLRPFADPAPAREISLLIGREHVRKSVHEALYSIIRDAVPAELRGRSRRGQTIRPLAAG